MKLVHIGAHRTGTTSLQFFLETNRKRLRDSGIQIFVPPQTRQPPGVVVPNTGDTILSEENILGTMENNIWQTTLYPDAVEFLSRHKHNIDSASAILLSIRDTADWWRSVILFSVERDLPLPTRDALSLIAKSKRGWAEVVKDVRKAYPHIPLFVKEHNWKVDNPKQVVKHITKDDVLGQCRLDKRTHNAGPAYNRLIVSLFSRNDFDGLLRVKADPALALFTKAQVAQMDKAYDADLEAIAAMDDVELLIDRDAHAEARAGRKFLRPAPAPDPAALMGPVCQLHIGKTGSDLVRAAFGTEPLLQSGALLCGPDETLATTLQKHGPYRKLAFFFRDPVKRFVDGFYGRLRQGRPQYQNRWTDGEAIAFSYFATPNALAEAIDGEDERLASAANYALEQIFHARLDQEFFLVSPQAVEFEHGVGNILVCCEYDHIESHLPKIGAKLGQKAAKGKWVMPAAEDGELSALALRNLNRALKKERAIYEACRVVAQDLGFGPAA